jgi:hypothetical protein
MKDKMRCASCGAMFKPVKSSQTKCERCERREREQRAAGRHEGGTTKTVVATPQPIRISGPAAGLLDTSGATSAPPPPPEPGGYGMAAWRDEERRERERREREQRERERIERERERAEHAQSVLHAKPLSGPARPRPPKIERSPQPLKPIKPPRVLKPVTPKIELTDVLRSTIEARYLELAKPVEFDGIRTRISGELRVPKSLVKKAIAELRARMALPSWWDLQAYTGAETDLERIRQAYLPLLPVPEVGVHKTLAAQLGMDPRAVYQGIRRIRAEMRLPQYNPPDLHKTDGGGPVTPQPVEAVQASPPDAHA